jgi:hypothetical protein
MDLNTAPKLLIIWHLLTELLSPNKRLALSRSIKINKTEYFPKMMADVAEKNFCDFLEEYSAYIQNKISCNTDLFSIFEGSLNITSYLNQVLCDMQDVSYLEQVLEMLISILRVVEIFLKLDKYFYVEPMPLRMEGNLIGMILRDLCKLYSFSSDCIRFLEKKIFQVDDHYSMCLYDQYVTFVRFTKRLPKVFKQ